MVINSGYMNCKQKAVNAKLPKWKITGLFPIPEYVLSFEKTVQISYFPLPQKPE